MPRGRPKKDVFEDLDQEYKDSVASMSVEDIKARIATIALGLDALMEAKKNDQDLADKQAIAGEAGKVYRDGAKGAKLRIRYASSILEARGK